MATAGTAAKTAVTLTATNPTSADVSACVISSSLSRNRAELETNYQGSDENAFILGRKGAEVPVEAHYVSTDPVISRLEAAFDSGATVYVHVLFDGSTGKRVPVKVPQFDIPNPQDGVVSCTFTLKSVGAVAASTLS